MQKIKNPYINIPGYNCFGCSPVNPHGLRMEFFLENNEVICFWEPDKSFQGYSDVLHGGIQAALMDETGGWAVSILLKTGGVTSKLELKYRKTVFTDQGKIIIKALLKEMKKNIAVMSVKLINTKGEVCTEGEILYFTFSPNEARERLRFPEYSEFFQDA